MADVNFNEIVRKTCDGCRITYGIIHGNETVVLIKSGAGKPCRGSKNKHLKMALWLNQQYGYSVICASNPYDCDQTFHIDKKVLCNYVKQQGFEKFNVYLVGTSDGADQILFLAKEIPQTEKLLCINHSAVSFNDLVKKLMQTPKVEKIFVYGTQDDEVEHASLLKDENIPNLKIITVEGANHGFTGMIDEYIALAKLL